MNLFRKLVIRQRGPYKAAEEGNVDKILDFIQAGGNVNAHASDTLYTALHLAAIYGHVDVASLLLENGADCNVIDMWRNRPIHLAVKHEYVGVAKLLLEHGADLTHRNFDGKTPGELAQGPEMKKLISDASGEERAMEAEKKVKEQTEQKEQVPPRYG